MMPQSASIGNGDGLHADRQAGNHDGCRSRFAPDSAMRTMGFDEV